MVKFFYPCLLRTVSLGGWLVACNVFAQGTGFTYQGRLIDGQLPAEGIYTLKFAIFDSDTNGVEMGPSLTNALTVVHDGLFCVQLDFGNQFTGAPRWLEIGVCTNGAGNFVTLAPRQPFTSAPYAIMAANVANSGISGVFTNPVVFSNGLNQFAGSGAGLTNLNAAQINGILSTATLPSNVEAVDPGYAAFIASNSITDPSAQKDLQGIFNVLNASGHRNDLDDILLLDSRFNPTNQLSLLGKPFSVKNPCWQNQRGFLFAGTNNLSSNTLNNNATNGLSFILPRSLVTNTVVITVSGWPAIRPHDARYGWSAYFGAFYGLENISNSPSGIWAGTTPGDGTWGNRMLEQSNGTMMTWDAFGDGPSGTSNYWTWADSMQAGISGDHCFADTKTFCFTADGHGRREMWIDGIKSSFGNASRSSYQSTNYPAVPLNELFFGSLDTNWLQQTASGVFQNRGLNYEVRSVQVYSCYADPALVQASYQIAQYVPPGDRADFFQGDSIFDQNGVTGWQQWQTWSNTLPVLMAQIIGQNNWHYFSTGGSRLDQVQPGLIEPVQWMPTDKYNNIWVWTDEGRNDCGMYGAAVPSAIVYSNFMAFYGPYKSLPNVHLGVLGSPQPGASNVIMGANSAFANSTNLVAFNLLEATCPIIDYFFPAWECISTNTMANPLWSQDTSHQNGTNGYQLVLLMADGLLDKPYYDPVSGVVENSSSGPAGITTNMALNGVTFYITNGLIERVSSP